MVVANGVDPAAAAALATALSGTLLMGTPRSCTAYTFLGTAEAAPVNELEATSHRLHSAVPLVQEEGAQPPSS